MTNSSKIKTISITVLVILLLTAIAGIGAYFGTNGFSNVPTSNKTNNTPATNNTENFEYYPNYFDAINNKQGYIRDDIGNVPVNIEIQENGKTKRMIKTALPKESTDITLATIAENSGIKNAVFKSCTVNGGNTGSLQRFKIVNNKYIIYFQDNKKDTLKIMFDDIANVDKDDKNQTIVKEMKVAESFEIVFNFEVTAPAPSTDGSAETPAGDSTQA